jgi:hypothetical protein
LLKVLLILAPPLLRIAHLPSRKWNKKEWVNASTFIARTQTRVGKKPVKKNIYMFFSLAKG